MFSSETVVVDSCCCCNPIIRHFAFAPIKHNKTNSSIAQIDNSTHIDRIQVLFSSSIDKQATFCSLRLASASLLPDSVCVRAMFDTVFADDLCPKVQQIFDRKESKQEFPNKRDTDRHFYREKQTKDRKCQTSISKQRTKRGHRRSHEQHQHRRADGGVMRRTAPLACVSIGA
jgi:hypothetical protein